MFEHLADLETELEKLESQLPELYASGEQAAARDAGRRLADLKPVVDAYREYRRTEADVADARELLSGEHDVEMRDYLQGELAERETRLTDVLVADSGWCDGSPGEHAAARSVQAGAGGSRSR